MGKKKERGLTNQIFELWLFFFPPFVRIETLKIFFMTF